MKKNKKTIWIVVLIALLFLAGFYLYYFHPGFIPGMADGGPGKEKSVINEEENGAVSEEQETDKSDTDLTESDREVEDEKYSDKTAVESEKLAGKREEVAKTEKIDEEQKQKKIEVYDISTEVVKKDSLEKDLEEEKATEKETTFKNTGLVEKVKERIKDLYDKSKSSIDRIFTPELEENINILIMGIDDIISVTRGKIEADTLILVKLYPGEQKVEFYNILTEEKYEFGETFTADKAGNLTAGIKNDLDVDVEYFVSISYEGFINLINNMNGVRINVKEDLKVPSLGLDFQSGTRTLSGEEALNYSRYLRNREDYRSRIIRQQQIITAIIKKAITNKGITDLPGMVRTIIDTFKMVDTNMDYDLITKITTYIYRAEELEINYKIISY